jgi:hypothetical protein
MTLLQILSPIVAHGFHVASSYLRLNTALLLPCVLAAAAAWVSVALPRLDQSLNDFTSQLGRAFLHPLPEGALLVLMSDSATNSVRRPGVAWHRIDDTLCRCVSCKRWRGIAPMCW